MRNKVLVLIGVAITLLMGILIVKNFRSVYFIDGFTGETTKLTSMWFKQNEIEIKDRWFSDFEEETVSGIIYIEDDNEYAIIPFAFTRFDDDLDLAELYKSELSRVKRVSWIEKSSRESLEFKIENEQGLLVAVGTYSGTSYDETEYGNGVYSIPLYNDNGDLHYNLQFPTSSLVGIREGFNDGTPTYILQKVIFTEISILNHKEETFLLPLEFIGGVSSSDVLDSDHYYYDYNGNQIIFEATLKKIK